MCNMFRWVSKAFGNCRSHYSCTIKKIEMTTFQLILLKRWIKLLVSPVAADISFWSVHWICHPSKEFGLRSERLCINFNRLFQPSQDEQNEHHAWCDKSQLNNNHLWPAQTRKMISLTKFISLVMEELRTSNLRSKNTKLKGFHTVFYCRI